MLFYAGFIPCLLHSILFILIFGFLLIIFPFLCCLTHGQPINYYHVNNIQLTEMIKLIRIKNYGENTTKILKTKHYLERKRRDFQNELKIIANN